MAKKGVNVTDEGGVKPDFFAKPTQKLAHKLTLSSGREVILEEMSIAHEDRATEMLSSRYKDNPTMVIFGAAKELMKMLVLQIDGKPLTAIQSEQIDTVLDRTEYKQVEAYINKMRSIDAPLPEAEAIPFGG